MSTPETPQRPKSATKSGQPIRGQAREIVNNVREYFEKHPEIPGNPVDNTIEATKCSRSTVYKVKAEKKQLLVAQNNNDYTLLSTPKKKGHERKPITGIDSFSEAAIRNHVYSYYSRKEYPTVDKLQISLTESTLWNGGITSLRTVLRTNLGFKFKKINGRKVLLERPDIVAWRWRFLREILDPNINLHDVVWLDETWVNAGHCLARCWTDDSKEGMAKTPVGKGGRLIVCHAGSSHGFVSGTADFHIEKTGDYHEEMNGEHFQDWFENKLLATFVTFIIHIMLARKAYGECTERGKRQRVQRSIDDILQTPASSSSLSDAIILQPLQDEDCRPSSPEDLLIRLFID
uniref:Uncharacterized protein n=2 Tax=Cacopsylla melanoneura TaxID=428564 RepID=A0A8D8S8S2_9HEMI